MPTESDSDDSIEHYGNRGHKLQKRARFSRRGQLAPTQGPDAYKEARRPLPTNPMLRSERTARDPGADRERQTIEYAGLRREIISRNPPLVDEDGYPVDSDDDDEHVHEALAEAAELNPYAGIRLERACRVPIPFSGLLSC